MHTSSSGTRCNITTLVAPFAPRDPRVLTPPVPVWKASGDADDAADAANEEATNEDGQAGGLRHKVS